MSHVDACIARNGQNGQTAYVPSREPNQGALPLPMTPQSRHFRRVLRIYDSQRSTAKLRSSPLCQAASPYCVVRPCTKCRVDTDRTVHIYVRSLGR